jgi:hypothetical protein
MDMTPEPMSRQFIEAEVTRKTPVEFDSLVYDHKLADLTQDHEIEPLDRDDDGEIIPEEPQGRLLNVPLAPECDSSQIPLGPQSVRVPMEFVAVARHHCALKRRTMGLLTFVRQKVSKFSEQFKLSELERQHYCTLATAIGFVPGEAELAAREHLDCADSRQKIDLMNAYLEGREGYLQYSEKKIEPLEPWTWSWVDNKGEETTPNIPSE